MSPLISRGRGNRTVNPSDVLAADRVRELQVHDSEVLTTWTSRQLQTREDVEKSGLEVIFAKELEQYGKDGKVSSSCVEQCFICLDQYESEDEVRLLICQHAFHRICVDKWLDMGNNSCPVCRATVFSAKPIIARYLPERYHARARSPRRMSVDPLIKAMRSRVKGL